MIPLIAIVGRPNVGKSTLFNRLTRSRDALVADRAGITRDRIYGLAHIHDRPVMIVDTGGLGDFETDDREVADLVSRQSLHAIQEADAVLWLVDGRAGLTATDESLAGELRPLARDLFLVVNKCDSGNTDMLSAEFHALGAANGPHPVSAQRGDGIAELMDAVMSTLPGATTEDIPETHPGLRVSVIGRPNVGKSTLINRMIGDERMLTFDQPGTTRDAVAVPFERQGKQYVLIDTAGVRRRSRIEDPVEKFSTIKSLRAMEEAQIVIAVIDAREALTEQDLNLVGLTVELGKPLIIAVNKWDGLEQEQRLRIRDQIDRKLAFADYACIHYISALHGSGVGDIFDTINLIGRSLEVRISPSQLTDILANAVQQHQPPMIRGRRIKLRYAHLGGHDPIRIIIHGNQTQHVPDSYRRYLAGYFRRQLKLTGIPILIQFKYGENPYRGKTKPSEKKKTRRRPHAKGKN
ncbi:MAG: ribosome biogenesis GTPase Der [Gammaproteobacteria bacterium]